MWGYKWGYLLGKWGYIGFCTPRHQLPGSASPAHASRRPNAPPWQARHTATAPVVAHTQQAPTTNRGRGRHSPGHGNTHGAHLAAADQGGQQSTNHPATQVFNGGKGCILRHSHTSNRAAHQHQILRGMTIFTGDTGDKL